MKTKFANSLLLAIERIFPLLGVSVKNNAAGLELYSDKPIQSEFLPGESLFQRGFFGLPGFDPGAHLASWSPPFFFVALGEALGETLGQPLGQLLVSKPLEGTKSLGRFLLWHKKPEALLGRWSLKRVENVPDTETYRTLDPQDQLAIGAIDLFTEHYLVMDSFSRGANVVGKVRVTNVDNGCFLLTRAMAKNPADLPKIWQAAEGKLAEKGASNFFLLFPEASDLPEHYGYQSGLTVEPFAKL